MASAIDIAMLEKNIGLEATAKLRAAFKSQLKKAVKVKGESKKATVRNRFKDDRLDRITFVAPHYVFKQHYGFEGSKKNGVKMRLRATDVLNKAFESSKVLETLADDLSNLRAEEVLAAVNFNRNGR